MMNVHQHEDEKLAFAISHGITYQAWGALGSPILGKGLGFDKFIGVDFERPELRRIAAAHGVSVQQVALRWVVQRNATLVVGTSSPEHMRSDARIFSFALSRAEMAEITGAAAGATASGGTIRAKVATSHATERWGLGRGAALGGGLLAALGLAAVRCGRRHLTPELPARLL